MRSAQPHPTCIIVEGIGLPGVGKSTLLHQAADMLRARGYPVSEESYRIGHDTGAPGRQLAKVLLAVGAVLRHPWRALSSLAWIRRSRQHSLHDFLRVTLNWFYINGLFEQQLQHPGIHCFDEGLFQACWSIGYRAGNPATLTEAPGRLFTMPTVMLIVSVSAEMETVAQRLHHRPESHSRLEQQGVDAIQLEHSLTIIQQIEMLIKRLAESREEHGHLQLVRVRNDENQARETSGRLIGNTVIDMMESYMMENKNSAEIER